MFFTKSAMYTKKVSVGKYRILQWAVFAGGQLEKSMDEYPGWDPKREIEGFLEKLFPCQKLSSWVWIKNHWYTSEWKFDAS